MKHLYSLIVLLALTGSVSAQLNRPLQIQNNAVTSTPTRYKLNFVNGGCVDNATTATKDCTFGTGTYLPLIGGVMTGAITFGAAGTFALTGDSESVAGTAGAGLFITSGNGATGDSGTAGAIGGGAYLYAGNGGNGSAAQVSGTGGDLFLRAGDRGANNGGGLGNGGNITIDAGQGSTAGYITIGPANTGIINIGRTAGSLGLYGVTAVVQPTTAALTNNVTSGGSANVLADFISLTTYATDAAVIRNDIYQLGEKVKQLEVELFNLGVHKH